MRTTLLAALFLFYSILGAHAGYKYEVTAANSDWKAEITFPKRAGLINLDPRTDYSFHLPSVIFYGTAPTPIGEFRFTETTLDHVQWANADDPDTFNFQIADLFWAPTFIGDQGFGINEFDAFVMQVTSSRDGRLKKSVYFYEPVDVDFVGSTEPTVPIGTIETWKLFAFGVFFLFIVDRHRALTPGKNAVPTA